jgi:hypothetical protein
MSDTGPQTDFREHPDPGYPARTEWNAANSDVTIDFAEPRGGRFVGSGGIQGLTRIMAEKHHTPYAGVPITPGRLDAAAAAAAILPLLPTAPAGLRVNIAGHGISGMHGVPQAAINAYVAGVLRIVAAGLALRGQRIGMVMSGGQTGFDEAGIVAARSLGIPTMVMAPRGWRFRGADGRDISGDRDAFVRRFATHATHDGGLPTGGVRR